MRYYVVHVISNGLEMAWASIWSDTSGLKGKLHALAIEVVDIPLVPGALVVNGKVVVAASRWSGVSELMLRSIRNSILHGLPTSKECL